MNRVITILAIALIVSAILPIDAAAAADGRGDPLRLMRRPDIYGGTIVFTWQGDLWTVPAEGGMARRLTVNSGIEDFPKFSPDGSMIAFTGDYNERINTLFVMPAEGGPPKQLTWHTDSAEPVEWTPDGKKIVFRSRRDSFVSFFKQFYTVSPDGGLPVDMGIGKGSLGSFSPDGKKMALNRHPERFWWWKRYKGSQNQDVWVYDFEKGTYDRLTDYEGNDSWPMWIGNRIYYVSDRDNDVRNIYYIDLDTRESHMVTRFTGRGVTWPSMNEDGSKIVFENDAKLFVLDTASGTAKEVVVYAPADDHDNMISYIDPMQYIRSFDISATGKRIVFEARGEIYTAPAEYGDVRNLTNSSGARDSYPTWSPDGKWIAYVSDKSGDDEVYLIDQMGKDPEKKLTDSGHFKENIMWSPESDRMLYSTEANELYMLGIDGKAPVLINKNEHSDITTYAWSPDGRWVAYDFARKNRTRDIFIYDTKEKKHHQITTNLADDTEPVFTPDGKNLLLISDRYHGTNMLCRISLQPEKEEPFVHKDDEENVNGTDDDGEGGDDDSTEVVVANDDDKPAKGKKGKKEKEEKVVVKIDFDGIEGRIRSVPRAAGRSLHNVNATDKYYYYLVMGTRRMMFRVSYDLYAYNLEKLKADKVASSIVSYGMSADKKKIATFDGSNFEIIKVGAKKSAKKPDADGDDDGGTLDIKRKVVMDLDRTEEWRQILREGWRVVKYHFYDPNYHGVDWDDVYNYYESLLPNVRTREELNWLMTEMVGELNASHQGVSGGDTGSVPRTSLAFLGAKLVLDEKSGYPRFEKIFKGDKLSIRERSPLDADYVKVKEGDYLLAVDGHELVPGDNFWQYLVAKTRNDVTITTNDKPTMKGAIETKIKPLAHDLTLRYKDWVDGNAAQVDKASDERIGYMHLKDMSTAGWIEFREKFEQFRYKDAVIIDVRYNGGGSIDTRIIDYLERRPYQLQRSRGESVITRPWDVFTGDVVVLINEYSYSDAEVFPSAVKERGLGTLIGVPTLGFVIAVTPHYLIDGGYIRKTFVGIWEESTGAQLESRGAIPDIYVESPPEMEKIGRDMQLEKAIEFLKDKIASKKDETEAKIKIEER
jgi:tricorn protease